MSSRFLRRPKPITSYGWNFFPPGISFFCQERKVGGPETYLRLEKSEWNLAKASPERGVFLREKSSSWNCAGKGNVPFFWFSLKREKENGGSHSHVELGSFGSDSMVPHLFFSCVILVLSSVRSSSWFWYKLVLYLCRQEMGIAEICTEHISNEVSCYWEKEM